MLLNCSPCQAGVVCTGQWAMGCQHCCLRYPPAVVAHFAALQQALRVCLLQCPWMIDGHDQPHGISTTSVTCQACLQQLLRAMWLWGGVQCL
jgi:hypothetical protein